MLRADIYVYFHNATVCMMCAWTRSFSVAASSFPRFVQLLLVLFSFCSTFILWLEIVVSSLAEFLWHKNQSSKLSSIQQQQQQQQNWYEHYKKSSNNNGNSISNKNCNDKATTIEHRCKSSWCLLKLWCTI